MLLFLHDTCATDVEFFSSSSASTFHLLVGLPWDYTLQRRMLALDEGRGACEYVVAGGVSRVL